MKKSIVAILAVAIIGALGIHANGEGNTAHSLVSSGSNGAGTSAATVSSGTSNQSTASQAASSYKDGTYTGASQDTPYGTVQIAVVISGGKIINVNFLQMPSDMGHSREVTSAASPLLKQTTLQKQGANIDFVSGATTTSEAYAQSLQAALNQAV